MLVKKRTKISWKLVIMKQFRLFGLWIHYFLLVSFNTYLLAKSAETRSDAFFKEVEEYIFCVLIQGDDDPCPPLYDSDKIIEFGPMMTFHILLGLLPISTFIAFARKELFLFWKEYFVYCFKNKTIALQFTPSFDPDSSISQNSTIRSLDEVEQETRAIKEI